MKCYEVSDDFYEQFNEVAVDLVAEYERGAIDLRRIDERRRYFADVVASDNIVLIVRNRARIQYWGAKTAFDRITSTTNQK